jgi:hypothetical protein
MSSTEQLTTNQNPIAQILKTLLDNKLNISWDDYLTAIHELPTNYKIAPSLKLLNLADGLMNQLNSGVLESTQSERNLIGGIADNKTIKEYGLDTELLGGMSSFAAFKKILKNDPKGVQKLLKIIPANGRIDGWHFMQFTDGYKQLFEDNGTKQAPLFPATRLLAMKRPDQFVCISPDTDDSFYQSFGIKPLKKQDFTRYWDEIILTIQKTNWFKQDLPMEPSQLAIYRARVCLLERLLNQPDLSFNEEVKAAAHNETINQVLQQNTLSESDLSSELCEEQLSNSSEQPLNKGIGQNQINTRPSAIGDFKSQPDEKIISKNGIDIGQNSAKIYQTAKQPKKLKIAKRKSDKVNKAAATKLMSQYYFANKAKFATVDMSAKREQIIEMLCNGESVEDAFEALI